MNNTNTRKLLTTFNLWGYEVLIETTPYTGLSYIKESATEREMQAGKVRVIISG